MGWKPQSMGHPGYPEEGSFHTAHGRQGSGRPEPARPVMKLSVEGTGHPPCFLPDLRCAVAVRVSISTHLSLLTLKDSAWPAGQNSLRLWVSTYVPAWKVPRLPQDVLCSVPSCPPDCSCRRPMPHPSCLSHCPRPHAAFPPAWPGDRPLSIPSCGWCLSSSKILHLFLLPT